MLQSEIFPSQIRASFGLPYLSMVLMGRQPVVTLDDAPARHQAVKMGAKSSTICILDAPSGPKGKGHKVIENARYDSPVAADGVLFQRPGSAAVLQTADCPALVLYHAKTHKVVLAHAGRPGMTQGGECATCSFTVLSAAMHRLLAGDSAAHVHAFILGSICGRCFVHDEPGAEVFVTPFDRYGEIAFTDRKKGALDLPAVITHELIHRGVPANHIHHDHLCTMEDQHLSSRRGGRYDTKNTVVVVRH
ncbi:MAG TPA: polyphenol oxidase family protein [Candidatus Paceibacterota bacterium]